MPDISVTIGMQQAWLLPAMPVVAFLIISFFRKLLPREGVLFGCYRHARDITGQSVHYY